MPQVVIAVAAYAAGIEVVTALSLVVGSLEAALVMGAVSFTVASIGNRLFGERAAEPSFSSEQQGRLHIVRSAVQPRRIIYGQCLVSGTLVAAGTSDRTGGGSAAAVGLTLALAAEAGASGLLLDGYDGVSPLELAAGTTFTITGDATTYTLSADAQWFAGQPAGAETAAQPAGVAIAFTPALAAAAAAATATTLSYSQWSGERGGANEYLHMVIALAGHQCEEIGDVYFGELLSSDARFSPGGTPYFQITKHLGTAAQTVDATLNAAVPAEWTSAHRLRGIAYLALRLRWNADVWTSGIPNVTALVKGRLVYDPRSTLTAYSDNWALCVRDYLTASFGLDCDASEIDETAAIAAANLADEDVQIDATPTTQKRYTCDGSFELSQTPRAILEAMMGSGAGMVSFCQGSWRILGGAYRAPGASDSLGEGDLRAPLQVTARPSRRELFNAVRGTYSAPDNFWQPTDYPAVTNATYATEDGGDTVWQDLALPFTTDPLRAQRIAKIRLEKARQAITVVFPARLSALRYRVGDGVKLTVAALGWSAKVFVVVNWALAADGGVDLTLQEEASSCYDWAFGEATVIDPAPDTTLRPPWDVDAVGGLKCIEDIYFDASGYHSRLVLRWTPSTDARLREYELQASVAGLADWHSARPTTAQYVLAPAPAGDYDIRVRAVTYRGHASAWATATVSVVGDHPLLSAIGLPAPAVATLCFTPAADGRVERVKVRVRLDQTGAAAPEYLALMLAVDPHPRSMAIGTDGGASLTVAAADVLASGATTILAGSTVNSIEIAPAASPLAGEFNFAGLYWGQYDASEWRKATGNTATAVTFRDPFDASPVTGHALNWVELAWSDERDPEWRLAAIVDGASFEVVRWDRIEEAGGVFSVAGLERAQEGTAQIAGDGATFCYYPAPGAGTQTYNLPLAALQAHPELGAGIYEGEIDVAIALPAGWWAAATLATWRNTADGIVRSAIVPCTYGGPL